MKELRLTPDQALKVTKSLSDRKTQSNLSLCDFDKKFSFASANEVKNKSMIVRAKFDKTIKELATR